MTNYVTAIEWSKGNPGAMSFLMELNRQAPEVINTITETLLRIPTIRGTSLYVLWSDLCDKDIEKVLTLCENCPEEELAIACSKQDYSGREITQKYILNGSN